MKTFTTVDITEAEALERAGLLRDQLYGRAADIAKLRRLPDDVFAMFLESGLPRVSQPRTWGGAQLPLATQLDVVSEIGRACGSAAWTMGVYISHNWNLALFDPLAQDDVWGPNPEAVACTSAVGGPSAERVPEGAFIRSGRWRFLSGVHHADWIVVKSPLAAEHDPAGQPELYSMLIPKGQYRIVEDWKTIGLSGTGTCSVDIEDVFVPSHRLLRFSEQQDGTTPGGWHRVDPIYRTPLDATWPAYLAAPAVGIARGAIDAWVDRTRTRSHAYTGAAAAAELQKQIKLGEAEARVDAAEQILRRAMTSVLEATEARAGIAEVRSRNRRDFALAVRLCVEAVESVFLASGASGLTETDVLQRHWRDVHAVAQHAMFEFERSVSAWGRRRLGVDDGLTF
ncbi:acyl-CoA dehydrogenase family protein [Nocardia yamanashiensis]|uniref:acyl-CoA dehydrogenase family protein n=1 Tax=Nocardia yamanashiensis TaxID=209247 RepID=UPI00082FD096|nr:acyl-CoA dehydrogenase family protein [Nocardia yamanashiensis]